MPNISSADYNCLVSNLLSKENATMANIITYQYSIFGRYESMEPSQQNLTMLMESLGSGFLPSVINAYSVKPTGEFGTKSCIQMINKNGFNIAVMPERLDVTYQYVDNSPVYAETDILSELACKYLVNTLETLSLTGWRLAINVRVGICRKDKMSMMKIVNSIAPYIQGDCIEEWNVYYNNRGKLDLCNESEVTNVITNIMCNPYVNGNYDFSVALDINTFQGKTSDRFSKKEIRIFSIYASERIKEKLHSTEGVLR